MVHLHKISYYAFSAMPLINSHARRILLQIQFWRGVYYISVSKTFHYLTDRCSVPSCLVYMHISFTHIPIFVNYSLIIWSLPLSPDASILSIVSKLFPKFIRQSFCKPYMEQVLTQFRKKCRVLAAG